MSSPSRSRDTDVASEVTILCLVRHGHATARMCVESLYAGTPAPLRVIYADIASPPAVQRYLEGLAATQPGFTHLRFDEPVSRQQARIEALRSVDTPFVVFLDNNMMCAPGWLQALRAAQQETGASMVSPIIVTRGGRIHFSAGRIVRRRRFLGRGGVARPHHQEAAPVGSMLGDVKPQRVEIDFGESHCCLASTDDLRLPGVMEERMHNAHTICYASYTLKHSFGKRLVLEPQAVVEIVPIGFGYDLPWMCRSYMRPDLLRGSYRMLQELIGAGPGTDTALSFRWHAKHLKYLLLTMLKEERFEREDLLAVDEIPAQIDGYDLPLPADADEVIAAEILPRLEGRYPELRDPLMQWLGREPPL